MKTLYLTGCLIFVLLINPLRLFAQEKIEGTVKDSNGIPLPGVNITIKEKNTGTQTNFDGQYEIEAEIGNTIEFSFVGYKNEILKVSRDTNYNITLEIENSELGEVILVGYGSQKRKDITGSISSFDAESFTERPISRIDQGLIGQVSGVKVKQRSGLPGAPLSINIRGAGSISASNEPLYVIDGFPLESESFNSNGNFSDGSPLDNINPNDIESIEILKDAAAAAIYGSRASNGVVLIQTKRGKKGKATISFNAYGGISKESNRVRMLNAEEWIERSKIMIDRQWLDSGIPGAEINQSIGERRTLYNQFQSSQGNTNNILSNDEYNTDYMYDPRWDMEDYGDLDVVDWQDRIFRTGVFHNYQLSASGGTDKTDYYISANYRMDEGYIVNTNYETFSARANMNVHLTDKLELGLNLAPSYSVKNDPGVEGKDNTYHKTIGTAPLFESNPNESGEKYTTSYAWGSSNTDPLPRLNRKGRQGMFRTLMSTHLTYEVLDGLTLKSTFNFDNTDNVSESYLPNDRISGIRGGFGTYRKHNMVNENTLNYSKNFKKHNFNLLLGHAYNEYTLLKSSMNSEDNYNSSSIQTLPNGSKGSTSKTRNVLISYFGRLNYDYDGKYLLALSLRRDGSSKFGPKNRWGLFPSISLGWNMAEESFLENTSVSDLKLRASYGINGSNSIGDYAWQSTLSESNYVIGGTTAFGKGVGSIPNVNLGWEESRSINLGLDIGLFNNRIFSTLDFYRKDNKDLLMNVPAAGASGFTSFLSNMGKVRNEGVEWELTSYNLTLNDFEWKTNLNISYNRNEVLQLGPDQERIEISSSWSSIPFAIMEIGKPMYQIHTIKQDGIMSEEDVKNNAPQYGGSPAVVGDPKYIDKNGDGKIDADDRVDIGNPFPKYIWGITNTFKYKNFDLSVLVEGQNGGRVVNLLDRAINRNGMSSGENHLKVDPEKVGNWKTNFGFVANSKWVYKSDYISVRNVTLGYNATKVFGDKVSNARIYLSAENWFNWFSYSGANPEATNASASSNSQFPIPADYGGVPIPRSFVLGLNFNL